MDRHTVVEGNLSIAEGTVTAGSAAFPDPLVTRAAWLPKSGDRI